MAYWLLLWDGIGIIAMAGSRECSDGVGMRVFLGGVDHGSSSVCRSWHVSLSSDGGRSGV